MIKLHASPILPAFEEFFAQICGESLICSPFISSSPMRRLVSVVNERSIRDTLQLTVLTDISVRNLVQEVTDIAALVFLCEQLPRSVVRHIPQIHAKVYIANQAYALITSANFTDGGAARNLEYGISIYQPELVDTISSDIRSYASPGAEISLTRMKGLVQRVNELRVLVNEEQRSINARLRAAANELEREAEDELLRARVTGRSINGIFADTILYLLGQRAMTTAELHAHIRRIHPDLCNDLLDRVIDGEHFGKLWKHQVRSAQQYLKKSGLILNDPRSRLWQMMPSVK